MFGGDCVDWAKMKEDIYCEDGSLLDIATYDNMTLEKWELLCGFLQENYDLSLFCNGVKVEDKFDRGSIEKMLLYNGNDAYIASFSMCKIDFNLFLCWGYHDLIFDFPPEQVDSLEKHFAIIDFMTQLANLLRISIKLITGMSPDRYWLKVDPATG